MVVEQLPLQRPGSLRRRAHRQRWWRPRCLLAPCSGAAPRQAATLVIVEKNSFLAEFLFKNCIFGAQVFNDFLLLTIDPAGKEQNQQLPRLQNEIHRHLGDQGKNLTIIGKRRGVNRRR